MSEIEQKERRVKVKGYIVNLSTRQTNPTDSDFNIGDEFINEDVMETYQVIKIQQNEYFGIKFYYVIEK